MTICRAYLNLHKTTPGRRVYSIQEKVDGRWLVTGYESWFALGDARFKVSESGRKRVIREGKKNVHAFVYGRFCRAQFRPYMERVTYRPKERDSFFFVDTEKSVEQAPLVAFRPDGIFAMRVPAGAYAPVLPW